MTQKNLIQTNFVISFANPPVQVEHQLNLRAHTILSCVLPCDCTLIVQHSSHFTGTFVHICISQQATELLYLQQTLAMAQPHQTCVALREILCSELLLEGKKPERNKTCTYVFFFISSSRFLNFITHTHTHSRRKVVKNALRSCSNQVHQQQLER